MIGKRLATLRKQKGLSVRDVADRLGVAASTYRDWEYGRKIKGEPYVKLAEIFDISLSKLLTGQENRMEADLLKIEQAIKTIRKKL